MRGARVGCWSSPGWRGKRYLAVQIAPRQRSGRAVGLLGADQRVERFRQLVGVARLREECGGARAQRSALHVRISGTDGDDEFVAHCLEFPQEFQPIQVRQADVDDDGVRRFVFGQHQRVVRRSRHEHFEPMIDQRRGEEIARRPIVVDQQYSWTC
jgi:hypothetical protein